MSGCSRGLQRIGFVSTRIAGTDGVSLEIGKWAAVLQRLGYECFYIGGTSDRPADRTALIETADFQHPAILEINRQVFGRQYRSRSVSAQLHRLTKQIKEALYEAVAKFGLDLLIAENAVTIPLNIPLGAAVVEFVIETGLPCIAHHHDFVWERERYLINAVDDYLRACFPAPLEEMQHVVINSLAGSEFSRRTGLAYHVIPNVMDFAHPPDPPDDYAADFRSTLGIAEDDLLILQPTRVVARKGIEHSIELVHRLSEPRCRLVISHGTSDEGPAYRKRLKEYAAMLGVEVCFADRWISSARGRAPDGRKQYAIWDVYPQADLVAYPSLYEGFGNAFLEAVYYRKPLLCNRYTIYQRDIEPYGFDVIRMDGFLTDDVVGEVRRVLMDAELRDRMGEHNYALARQHFSYERAEAELRTILCRCRPCPSEAPTMTDEKDTSCRTSSRAD